MVTALPPPETAGERKQALDELRDTTDTAVGQAAGRVAGLSPEDEEGWRRSHRNRERQAWADVRVWAIKSAGGIGIAIAIAAASAASAMFYRWVGVVMLDPTRLDQIIKGGAWTALTALSTLALSKIVGKSD